MNQPDSSISGQAPSSPPEPAESAAKPHAVEVAPSEAPAAAIPAEAAAPDAAVPNQTPPSEAVLAGSETVDLEQLEAQIHARLKRVVERARAVRESVDHLLQQGRALAELGQVAEGMIQRRNKGLEGLLDQEFRLGRERLAKIRECRAAVEQVVELRELTMDAHEETWNRYQATFAAGSTAWFRELAQSRADHDKEVARLRAWWTAAEQRWLPSATPVAEGES